VDGDRDLTLGAAGRFNPLVSFPPSELQGVGMTAARLPMRQIREVLRLHYSSGLSQHAIARSLGMSQGDGRLLLGFRHGYRLQFGKHLIEAAARGT